MITNCKKGSYFLRNTNKKKGFTLIELLAVIVILAIIALIATPIILNMISDAKKSAAKDSAYGYIEAIEYQNSMSQLDSTKYSLIESGEVTTLDVKVKGTPPTKGNVTIINGRVTEANLCINNYSVHYDGTTATIEGNACDGTSKPTEYTVYANGTAVYYNPVDGTKCSANDAISKTGTKTGCMKFYTFNDEGKNASTVNMILDHNTTALVAWNSTGSNSEMKEVKTALESDTINWKETARLIKIDEITQIVGKTLSNGGTIYSANWLYDYTYGCISFGCNASDDNNYVYSGKSTNHLWGYWTSSLVENNSSYAWDVRRDGRVYTRHIGNNDSAGVRPVITIEKALIS